MRREPAVVLDRDGTIIVERHYLSDPDQVALIPEAAKGLRQLQALGLRLVVITNQSGIGRGFFDEVCLERIHRRMRELLAAEGVRLDGIYVCPHRPEDNCACRKPEIGLLTRAARELGFDPRASFVVGDKPCDIELGRRVHATTFLVRTGYGAQFAATGEIAPDYVAEHVGEVAQVIRRLLEIASTQVRPPPPASPRRGFDPLPRPLPLPEGGEHGKHSPPGRGELGGGWKCLVANHRGKGTMDVVRR